MVHIMTIPSYAEAVAIARKINVSGIMGREGLADFGIKFMREAQEREMGTEDKLRRADVIPLEDLALYWQGRANALRMVDAAAKKSNEATIESANAYEECAVEIRAALAATQEQPARFNGEQALAEWEGKHGGGK